MVGGFGVPWEATPAVDVGAFDCLCPGLLAPDGISGPVMVLPGACRCADSWAPDSAISTPAGIRKCYQRAGSVVGG